MSEPIQYNNNHTTTIQHACNTQSDWKHNAHAPVRLPFSSLFFSVDAACRRAQSPSAAVTMMPSRLAFCLVFLLSFASVALAEEQTCTAGRLFLSDSVQAAIHVYDLDGTAGPQFVSSLASAAPAMSLYSSETFSARVAAVFAGNATTGYLGRVQLFRSGITTESHGDHSDIVKVRTRTSDTQHEHMASQPHPFDNIA